MAIHAENSVGFMRLMAHSTFKVVRFRNMVAVRIEFVFLVFFNPFVDRIPRAMILARKTGFGGRSLLGSAFAAMTGAACYASILVPVSRVLAILFFTGFLTYGCPYNQQGGNGHEADNFFHHN